MKVQTLVLLMAAVAEASWECRNRSEKFRTDKAPVPKRASTETSWTYCPIAAGCCTDGNEWYACKAVSFCPS
ncbi:hypothetical protein COCMIDRAFT_109025 [Bipolaris oryzae ATCC 44560]|uniref:Uncharacterized protein n=1 Tax=Bipolaris oryzae ATCC 44560 TaxID=930090 RepID=W6Z9J4_COCMI|nr:uncharacterized protein COCMIDRAFT_109025 [Bipolaris oryzae ATCC 44560]EUC40361.1 hypothetical protein COCMIDRAFT_109025 [Bipolaris oryzae ATCC 44560]